jgi:hypothetical protein
LQQASVLSVLKRGRLGASARFIRFFGPSFGAEWFDEMPMRCVYCRKRAGLMRRVCDPCGRVVAVVERAGGEVGMAGLVDLFMAEGLTREQVDVVLDAQLSAAPTLRDRLTSNMANALMRGLGMPGRQSPEDVKRIREAMKTGGAGTWVKGEAPPPWSH